MVIPDVSNNGTEASSKNISWIYDEQVNQKVMECIYSQPDLLAEALRRLNIPLGNTVASAPEPQTAQSSSQSPHNNHHTQLPYVQQTQVQQQQEVSPTINSCQPSQLCSIDDNYSIFEEDITNILMLQSSEDNHYLTTTNQVK